GDAARQDRVVPRRARQATHARRSRPSSAEQGHICAGRGAPAGTGGARGHRRGDAQRRHAAVGSSRSGTRNRAQSDDAVRGRGQGERLDGPGAGYRQHRETDRHAALDRERQGRPHAAPAAAAGVTKSGRRMILTRRRFLTRVGAAGGASLVYEAMTGLGLLAAPAQTRFELSGRVSNIRVLILGAGVAGLTAAYELGKVGYDCRLLEGRARPGGRVFTVRRGTVSEEDGPTQTAAFDEGLYLNAGPMRISQHHHTAVADWP